MNDICLFMFECLQKKSIFVQMTSGRVNYVYFLVCNLKCFIPPQISQSYILRIEILIGPNEFLKIHSNILHVGQFH